MMPAAVESSIEFLDSNPEFAACQGRMAAFRIPAPGQVHIDKIDGRMRTEDDAGDRILRQLANFTPTLYAIHRREVFMECCLRTLEYTTNVTFWQYLASCIALLRGKLGTVDELHYVRLNNELGWRSQLIGQRDPSHWPYLAVSGDFSTELARFRSALLALLGTDAETDLSRRIDDACIWLIRRGLCRMTEAPPEPGGGLPHAAPHPGQRGVSAARVLRPVRRRGCRVGGARVRWRPLSRTGAKRPRQRARVLAAIPGESAGLID